jgi:ATP-dependent helicase/DNAse subunit B
MFRYEFARTVRQLDEYATWLIEQAAIEPFTVLACEQRVDIPLGMVRLVGKVDRIDRIADGSLVVRDYKSGRMHVASAKILDAALDRLVPDRAGLGLFGNAPENFKMQGLLYVRGVEAQFDGLVSRADYIYLAGAYKKGAGPEICVDSIAVVDEESRRKLDAVYDVIALGIARELLGGGLTAFPTALDEKACKYCNFKAICPGPGTVNYASPEDSVVPVERSTVSQLTMFDRDPNA